MHTLIYITFPNRETTLRIGRKLVESRLAAGVNIISGVQSFYRWQGRVHEATEYILFAQTDSQRIKEIEHFVKTHHSHEVPCIIAIPIARGNQDFLDWITENCAPEL